MQVRLGWEAKVTTNGFTGVVTGQNFASSGKVYFSFRRDQIRS